MLCFKNFKKYWKNIEIYAIIMLSKKEGSEKDEAKNKRKNAALDKNRRFCFSCYNCSRLYPFITFILKNSGGKNLCQRF